jgi:hypothetical protein
VAGAAGLDVAQIALHPSPMENPIFPDAGLAG